MTDSGSPGWDPIRSRDGERILPRSSSPRVSPKNSLGSNADHNISLECGDMNGLFRSSLQERRLLTPSPGIEDMSRLRVENTQLKSQLHQAQMDFQAEQDSVIQLKKRLNNIEKDRLMSTTRSNNEITTLESETTKLRAQLEKGEATRQNLEFELAKTRRDLNQVKKESAEKTKAMNDSGDQLKEKIAQMSEEMSKLQQQIREVKESAESAEKRLQCELEEKEQILTKCQTEKEVLRADRDKLEHVLQENDHAISELGDRLQDAETERQNHIGILRRTTTELDYAKERGEQTKKELAIAVKKIRSLESLVEAERAAHLESKFNSEITQLRVRDLEGAVEVEKGAQVESTKTVESLGLQIRELQNCYEEQKRLLKENREKHERLEKEHDSVRYQLTAEVEDKKNVIQNLSKQLEVHQKNFNELKDELAKAKKRQVYLEGTYGGSIREMELLVNTFNLEDGKKKKVRRCEVRRESKAQDPSAVLESLRHILTEYRQQLEKRTEELKKAKAQSEKLTKENTSQKASIASKDKAIEDTQKSFAKASRELMRVRSDYSDLETLLARMKLDLHSTSRDRDKDMVRAQELSEELMNLAQKHRAENEEKMLYLHSLYQQLLSGRVMPSFTDKPFPQYTWQDMGPLVREELATLVQQSHVHKQQVGQLEEILGSKEEVLISLEREHTQQVYQLNNLNTDREQAWLKQKEELEAHFNQLIADIQNRSKKSQAIADQAWEKVRMSGSVRQGLESECVELRTRLAQTQQDNTGLHLTLSLLCGALYPLYARANALAAERRLLEDELFNFYAYKNQVQGMVNAISAEFGDKDLVEKSDLGSKQLRSKRHPLLTFRVGVVAVMAANRLKHVAKGSSKMFVTYDTISGNHGLLVCTGGVTADSTPFRGVGLTGSAPRADVEENNRAVVDWLTSADLLSTVLASVTDLQDVIGQIRDSVNPVESRALTGSARTCFTRLLDRLVPYFENVTLQPMGGLRDKHSLIRRLGKGLHTTLQKSMTVEQKASMVSHQEGSSLLQQHLLQLTQRLHGLEVERRTLLMDNSGLKQDSEELTACKQHMAYLEDEVHAYREQAAEGAVPLVRFENICAELNNALSREEQAQTLLIEQSRQLEEFSTRLQAQNQQGALKEHTLSEAVQGLSQTKGDLKRKEQSIRQLNKSISQLEVEKMAVQKNLSDAENALRTAAKDKEILATYITTVESAVNQVKKTLSTNEGVEEVSLPKMLLNVDFIPADVGKAGPELIACQNLVGEFVDTLVQLFSRTKTTQAELASHKQHIGSLKTELSAAINREYQEDYPVRDVMGLTRMGSQESVNKEGFYQLKEDSEISFNIQSPSPKLTSWKQSPIKTPHYRTPKLSRSYPRPKSGPSSTR